MRENSGNGVVVGVTGLILLLIILVGAAFLYITERQRAMLVVQAEQARAAEASARMIAEEARAKAEAALPTPDSPLPTPAIRAAVEAVFRAQVEAWNRGDVEAFMEHYWKSDDLTFSSGGKTTRGWNATLDRYRERYPTRETMGRLTLSGFEITPLGNSAALVLGEWKLARETEPVSGNFTLVLRKIDDRWLIVHDHTSRLAD
jgi:beta-aspartyl-peptidase (threonine type)